MALKREDGYYWIIRSDGIWEVAFFDGSAADLNDRGWYSIWEGGAYRDSELEAIGDRVRVPEGKNEKIS